VHFKKLQTALPHVHARINMSPVLKQLSKSADFKFYKRLAKDSDRLIPCGTEGRTPPNHSAIDVMWMSSGKIQKLI
jgi:hypothetical protein